jgi:hypothetical protein
MRVLRMVRLVMCGLMMVTVLYEEARGEDFHVSTADQFREALQGAESNDVDDTIYLASGIYKSRVIAGIPQTFGYTSSSNKSLTILGSPGTCPGNIIIKGGMRIIYNLRHEERATLIVKGVTIQEGFYHGLTIGAFSSDVAVQNCVIRNNRTNGTNGGGVSIECEDCFILLENNMIINNVMGESTYFESNYCQGGGIYLARAANLVVRNNLIANNGFDCPSIENSGGGMYIRTKCDLTAQSYITGNTVTGNQANTGGGIYHLMGTGNTHNYYNNIVYGNTATTTPGVDFHMDEWAGDSAVNGFNNDIGDESCTWATANNNVNIDPMFEDSAARNYHLKSDSVLIDAGAAVPAIVGPGTIDLDRLPREMGAALDIGAYEYSDRSGTANPMLDIKINGSDGPIDLHRSDTADVSLSLISNGDTNQADWWIVGVSPGDIYSMTFFNWKVGLIPFYQAPLFDVPTFSMGPTDLTFFPAGSYTFIFCVDLYRDGLPTGDNLYYDSVVMNILE